MGAIAERGDEKGTQAVFGTSCWLPPVFRDCFLRSQSKVEVKRAEKFRNCTTTARSPRRFFIAPESVLAGTGTVRLPTNELYVIANAKLTPQFELSYPRTSALLGRSIGLALQYGLRA